MHVPVTLAALLLLTAALLLLRLRGPSFLSRNGYTLLCLAIATIFLITLSRLLGWETASFHFNAILTWARVAAYELLLLMFTLFRPRWLTALCAVILFIPLLAASALLPLTELFDTSTRQTNHLAGNVYFERLERTVSFETPTVEYNFFDRPLWAPFLHRGVPGVTFNQAQCNTEAISVTLEPDHRSVRLRCPFWPIQQLDGGAEAVVKLRHPLP